MVSLICLFKLYTCQDPRKARAYSAQSTKENALLACLAWRLSVFTSMRETDTAARGAVEPHPEDCA